MMTNQHPITPPPELEKQWFAAWERGDNEELSFADFVIPRAAAWGADQELEACCEWVGAVDGKYGPRLRLARRPKSLSLKEQALEALASAPGAKLFTGRCTGEAASGPEYPSVMTVLNADQHALIRRALEQIPE